MPIASPGARCHKGNAGQDQGQRRGALRDGLAGRCQPRYASPIASRSERDLVDGKLLDALKRYGVAVALVGLALTLRELDAAGTAPT